MQSPDRRDDINVQAPRFILACTTGCCRHCRATTRLFALAVPPGHLALELDEEAHDEATAVDTWRMARTHAFLLHVGFVSEAVRLRLRQLAPCYRPGAGGETADACWTNHCEHCGAVMDDQELFCEPDGAFQPASAASAARIHLVSLDQPFEAVAGGYVHEPEFFDAMSS